MKTPKEKERETRAALGPRTKRSAKGARPMSQAFLDGTDKPIYKRLGRGPDV